jgi:hypothetical protein
MRPRVPARRGCAAFAVAVVAAGVAAGASSPPSGAVVFGTLKTFPVTIDVDLELTERTSWKGIQGACPAPAENFTIAYRADVNSRPRGKSSRITPGTATVTTGLAGVTAAYGDRGSFRQFSVSAPWELQTQNPPSCGQTRPVPDWASSPTCRRLSERVAASLQTETDDRNGRLVLERTVKARPTTAAGAIGESCLRTLRDPAPVDEAAAVVLSLRRTLISIPVRSLRAKLVALAEGSARARPSFRLPIEIDGDCRAMTMRGSFGKRSGYVRAPWVTLNRALGSPSDLATAATCTIRGRGDVVVQRTGKVTGTAFRPGG